VDSFSVLEITSATEQLQGEVIGPVRLSLHMARTEHGSRVENPRAAFSALVKEVKATMGGRVLLLRLRVSFFLSLSRRRAVPYPGRFLTKEFVKGQTNGRLRKKWYRSVEGIENVWVGWFETSGRDGREAVRKKYQGGVLGWMNRREIPRI